MAKTKGDLVLKALRKAGLYSETTVTLAEPQDISNALIDLEDMMAAWQANGIELGYNFAPDNEKPTPHDESGLPAWAYEGVSLKLAVQMCIDNVIVPSDILLTAADNAYQTICISLTTIPSLARRSDMPRGAGNKGAFARNKFYNECKTPGTRGD